MDDPYAKYRDEIRAKGMMATPFRLGIAVGHAGDDLPSPYPKGNRGDQLYRDGLELGRLRRANEAGRAAAPEPPAHRPMTDEEIDAVTGSARDALLDHLYEYGPTSEGAQAFVRMLARAVERHHNIGKEESDD